MSKPKNPEDLYGLDFSVVSDLIEELDHSRFPDLSGFSTEDDPKNAAEDETDDSIIKLHIYRFLIVQAQKNRLGRNELIKEGKRYLKSLDVEDLRTHKRVHYLDLIDRILDERNDLMVKADWETFKKILTRQSKYLEVYSSDAMTVGRIKTMIEKIEYEIFHASDEKERVMKVFVDEFMNSFYRFLSDEESLDHAVQIIMNSKA
ncbi:MAG: hypothetical protein CL670_00500 [Balneola sp.]|jgi:hypothetical protein|nr:hypothetical protein [Balneola sp.]MBE77615.1 hypothetical protein [Balneola sp.]HBX65181.1 hypothetical protein [Balneolaceae bacterium]|tara:strand:+ start:207 stop:818 length:612 start_codon:yes stop_codon:yes gene_type:complete